MRVPKVRQFAAIAALTGLVSNAPAQNIDFQSIQLETVKIADGLYVLMGAPAQGNIVVFLHLDSEAMSTWIASRLPAMRRLCPDWARRLT